MDKVNAIKYQTEILKIIPLYRYLAIIVNETNVAEKLKEIEYDLFVDSIKEYLIQKDEMSIKKKKKGTEPIYQKYIETTLGNGLKIIKEQLLVSAYSTFALFLEHLVFVYCQYFPKLYEKRKIKMQYTTVKKTNNQEQIKDIFLDEFINDFGLFSFKEKIAYIKENLKLDDESIWALSGENKITEINQLRNSIVHSEKIREISDDRFTNYINYLSSVVFKLAAFTQADHGIEFVWIKDTNINIKMAEKPIL